MNSVLHTNNKNTIVDSGDFNQLNHLKKLYIETYGCQMNVADSEIITGILTHQNFILTKHADLADVILINTCSIRKNAEDKVFRRIENLNKLKQTNKHLLIGVVGCMAEHSQTELLDIKSVDIIAGPDNYSSLPDLIKKASSKGKAVSTDLSDSETYDSISPIHQENSISAFVPIMRGCNNFCSYCVVPYTRGTERSRNFHNILNEIKILKDKGFKEVTLIGQNVNSYNFSDSLNAYNFAHLLEHVANISTDLRVRFATSHPKDFNPEIVRVIADHNNVCKHIHLPFQSGSNRILDIMNRKYTREWYLDRISMIRDLIPEVCISTDIITGFCTETEIDHQLTLDLMESVRFDLAYMFFYSERKGTYAAKHFKDDIPLSVKKRRLNEIITLQSLHSLESNKKDVDKTFEILIEGISKKSSLQQKGRNSQNKMVVFQYEDKSIGDYVKVKITDCTSATLIGETEKDKIE